MTKIAPFIHNMACQQKINGIPNKHSPIINIRVSFLKDQITHPNHKQGLERLFVCVTSIKHNKNREWKITKPSNACFDFQITKRNERGEKKKERTVSLRYSVSAQSFQFGLWTMAKGECFGARNVEADEWSALKCYWKVNIIKNFFYCILHAPFNSIWLLILCTLPL